MRFQAYRVFEIVAWPAAVWCGIEVCLRTATAEFNGMPLTAATGALAAMTVVACRWRSTQLATAPAAAR